VPDEAAITADATDLPADLQEALAEVVLGAFDAAAAWKAIVARSATTTSHAAPRGGPHPPDRSRARHDRSGGDSASSPPASTRPRIVEGGVRLAYANRERRPAPLRRGARLLLRSAHAIGRIVIRDDADDTYADDSSGSILLVVDTGGNDTYERAVGAGFST